MTLYDIIGALSCCLMICEPVSSYHPGAPVAFIFLPHSPVAYGLWLWFPMIWEWFPKFLQSYHRKKHSGKNRIDHGHEFLFHRNHLLSLVIFGMQTYSGELHSARSPMMDSLYLGTIAPVLCKISIIELYSKITGVNFESHQGSMS